MAGTLVYKQQLISGAPAVTDNVTPGNMRPVTSNAVAAAMAPLKYYVDKSTYGAYCTYQIINKIVTANIYIENASSMSDWQNIFILPAPAKADNVIFKMNSLSNPSTTYNFYILSADGRLQNGATVPAGHYCGTVTYKAK